MKGIDYVGDIGRFAQEFAEDLAVLAFARKTFALPEGLKLSIHSGSDKFTLYPIMHRALRAANAGIHLKTAGTTWLEEVIGLAAAGREGLAFAKALYREARASVEELRYYFILCRDLGYDIDFDEVAMKGETVSRMLDGLLRSMLR